MKTGTMKSREAAPQISLTAARFGGRELDEGSMVQGVKQADALAKRLGREPTIEELVQNDPVLGYHPRR